MILDRANPFDVYFAFRLAFVDRPDIRIRTVEHIEGRDTRPGYSSGRFVTPAAPPVQVFITESLRWDCTGGHGGDVGLERQALQTADARNGVHHPDPVDWAAVVRKEYGR